MEIKDYVKQFRDLQKSHKKVRVADFCRENMLDYYEMVEALKQDKFEMETYEEQVQCGDLVITEIPKGLKLTVREINKSASTKCR